MLMQGQVQAPPGTSATDGNTYTFLQGKTLELMVSELHGKYATQTMRGNVAYFALTTATAIPIAATNATPNFFIWNPLGNNRAVSLIRLNAGFSAGTGVAGAIGYSYVPNSGGTVAGSAPVSAATPGTVRSRVLGAAYAGQVIAGTAATVTGTGIGVPVRAGWSNFSQGAPLTSTAAMYSLYEDFDGTMVIPPGVLWYPDASTAVAETVMLSAVWEEIPWP